jgi:hypothetical protein
VAQPRRKKSLKERHLHDSRLIFTPKLKRTPLGLSAGAFHAEDGNLKAR